MGLKPDRAKFITQDELKAMLAAALKVSRRDHMLLALAGNLGLRASEVVELAIDQFQFEPPGYDAGAGVLRVRTRKQRTRTRTFDELWVHPRVARAARAYIKWSGVLRSHKGYLFPSRWDLGEHITTRTAENVFKRWAKVAGVDPRASFHALRHGYGVALWEATKDQRFVQAGLRHASMRSTGIYVHLSPERQEELRSKLPGVV